MDIRVLRYFLAVAREENITRAAQSLHIAQPSLSKQILELEAELGKKLFIRGKRKVTLTEEGLFLRKRAEEIVKLLEKTEQELTCNLTELAGEISIGGNTPDLVLQAAASLRKQYSDISFHFYIGDVTDVTERLEHGSLDFAIFLEPIDPIKYEFLSLPTTSLWGILMKKDSIFAKQSEIYPSDLLKMPLILHRRIGLQQEIAHWAHTNLEQLNIVATYNVVHGSPVSFVKNGLGYFLTTRDLLSPELDSCVCFRPLKPSLPIRYAIVWKQHHILSKAAKAFLEQVRLQLN